MYRRTIGFATLLITLSAIAAGPALATAGSLGRGDLQAVRAAVAMYNTYRNARAAGYSAADEPCVSSPAGTMGYHAVNQQLAGSGSNDPLRPPILLYAPRDGGGLKLVGVEYWHIAIANTGSGAAPWFGPTPPPLGFLTPTPSLFGQPFNDPMPGHNPQMPWHFDLHAWVMAQNPAGVFAIFNPAISC
ncbi:MAG: hypothetical protein HYX55_00870 [Chloroflexi bacterium]|nr:hypothetical protein [Chloroflexota bacterium]